MFPSVTNLPDTSEPHSPSLYFFKQVQLYIFSLFQGADIFAAKINIEVQRASEGAIAAIERNGGVISTGFYDPISLGNFSDPGNVSVCIKCVML